MAGGRITIGIVSTAKYVVPHMLARFQRDYPGIDLELRDSNRQRIVQARLAVRLDPAVMGRLRLAPAIRR